MVDFNRKWKKHLTEGLPYEPDPLNMPSFEVNDRLNPALWATDDFFDPDVRNKLIQIAADFLQNAEIEGEVVDLTVTGSMANFNWTKFSDIDLHIVINFRDIGPDIELIRELFKQRTINWNLTHNIMIYDHEVEIYVQNKDEPHVSSGIYSLLSNRWIVRPTLDKPRIDYAPIEEKVENLVTKIEKVENLFNSERFYEAYDYSKRIKRKIKKMRQCGLEKGGVFSTENLAFKHLRNTQFLEKLRDFHNMSYDKMLSLDEKR